MPPWRTELNFNHSPRYDTETDYPESPPKAQRSVTERGREQEPRHEASRRARLPAMSVTVVAASLADISRTDRSLPRHRWWKSVHSRLS
ncbi:unnamed protein product [Lampetra planeri]